MLVAIAFFAATSSVEAAKNQMVKGKIKSVDASAGVLIVNQDLGKGKEPAIRQLSIEDDTEFVVKENGKEETAVGKGGLKLLVGTEGSSIQVKCDKDVKVLKVTVTIKK